MIAIGMIGADSTHTEAYTKLLNLPDGPLYGRARVTKLWGEDQDQAAQKAAQLNIPQVVATPAEAMAAVDVVMVCNRYGDDHPPHARLAIEAGLPTFIDKPFANDYTEAKAVAQLAVERGVPLLSCSAVRYAVEVLALTERLPAFGPLNCVVASGQAAGDFPNPRAKHPFFYGIHAVELLHTLLGSGAQSVATRRTPRCDIAFVAYDDGRQGIINLLHQSPSLYHAAIFGATGWDQITIADWNNFYVGTLTQVITMAETGAAPYPIEWALEVMAIMSAVVRSAEQNGQAMRLRDL